MGGVESERHGLALEKDAVVDFPKLTHETRILWRCFNRNFYLCSLVEANLVSIPVLQRVLDADFLVQMIGTLDRNLGFFPFDWLHPDDQGRSRAEYDYRAQRRSPPNVKKRYTTRRSSFMLCSNGKSQGVIQSVSIRPMHHSPAPATTISRLFPVGKRH